MKQFVLAFAFALTLLAALPALGSAKPLPPRQVETPEDMQLAGCAFPVLAHVDGVEIITTFVDRFGTPIRILGIFPGDKLTLTNLDTGSAISLSSTAAFQLRALPDNGFSLTTTGGGLLPDGALQEPGIWWLNGQLAATFDANGDPTSITIVGRLENLCLQLAG